MNLPELPFPPSPPTDALGSHYIERLERLLRLRRELEDELNSLGAGLLERAIAATVKDCEASGAGAAARRRLRRANLRRGGAA